MAIAPTKPLIRIAINDTTLPSTGLANKLEPPTSVLTTGYDANELVAAEDLNFTFDNIGSWVQYALDRISELQQQIITERVSIGEIIEITGDSTNPSILKGYGTWESFGEGRVLLGVGEFTDTRGESKTWIDGQNFGEYSHIQTESEMSPHTHTYSGQTDSQTHSHTLGNGFRDDSGTETDGPAGPNDGSSVTVTDETTLSYTYSGTTDQTGDGQAFNITQPSLAVYRWTRVA